MYVAPREGYLWWPSSDEEEEETAREGPHLPRMAAETGRVAADNPVAPGVELAAA